MAINVSPYQVMAADFHTSVQRTLRRTGIDPAGVCLEVTENAFLEDGPRAMTVLKSVKDLGVSLVLDDFGTGYSSLNYLRRFPFDVIKIDRSFIGGLATDDGTYEIVAAIIDLAHGLKLDVAAEGIETQQQLSQVTSLGADQAQGFHICRPTRRSGRTTAAQRIDSTNPATNSDHDGVAPPAEKVRQLTAVRAPAEPSGVSIRKMPCGSLPGWWGYVSSSALGGQ